MRYYLLIFACFISADSNSDNSTSIEEFVPIGKDLTPPPVTERPLPKSVGKVISHKVFTEDGIKYTEIVRQTPSGGRQVAHIQGDVNPSLLPVPLPMPNIGKFMEKLATRIEVMRQEPVIETSRTPIHPIIASRPPMSPPARGPMFRAPSQEPIPTARVEVYTPEERPPYIYRPYAAENGPPPPPYPPFMYQQDGLLGRVGSMTGSILDNVMDFVVGRRRR